MRVKIVKIEALPIDYSKYTVTAEEMREAQDFGAYLETIRRMRQRRAERGDFD